MNGKGSTRRPSQVSDDEYRDNWARTFGHAPSHVSRPEYMAEQERRNTMATRVLRLLGR